MAEPREEPHTTRAHELRQLLAVGAPCVYGKIFGFWCPAFITLVCVGRSGELAAVGLAMSYSNALGFSINVGLSQAIDSLCSQAYGAGAYLLLGDVLQRALLVMAAFNGGATLLWLCAEGVLVACGQDPLLSASAAAYLRALLPALWAHALSIATQRWLGAQGETRPLLAISTLTLCAHAALAPVLTREGRLGFVGAAVSWSVASTLRAGLTVVFAVAWPKLHVCWGGWSARAALDLDELRRFLGLGLPSVMMLCTEWWAFELVAFMAGLLPDPRAALQAYALLFNVSNLLFMIPLGLGVGTAVRVGQALGRGEPRRARRTVAIALSADACAFGLAACALLSPPVRTHIAALFLGPAASTQRSAAGGASASALVAAVLPWVVLGQLGDNIKEICNGVLRGAGRQALGARRARDTRTHAHAGRRPAARTPAPPRRRSARAPPLASPSRTHAGWRSPVLRTLALSHPDSLARALSLCVCAHLLSRRHSLARARSLSLSVYAHPNASVRRDCTSALVCAPWSLAARRRRVDRRDLLPFCYAAVLGAACVRPRPALVRRAHWPLCGDCPWLGRARGEQPRPRARAD